MQQDYEKLAAFYLGREYDLETKQTKPDLLLYDSKDLTTHAMCVGMTGSGKTGLCLGLLEEAAIDGIPVIAIDPKGDLGNLMLTFPNLQPHDFLPWVDDAEAQQKGLRVDQYAERVADLWRDGLAQWGQDGSRIARFKRAADVSIYTPGSSAGLPLTVLRSFSAPPAAIRQNSDAMRERVSASASGLLALLGIDADPIRSQEHILLSNLLNHAWERGRDLDIPGLIRGIQQPPFDKVGFMDLDTFYPQQERFELSMQLNNLVASPSFSSWMEGEPLDIKRLLYTPKGKPRISIISIAHLSDSERMFFVTILLNEFLAWTRSQSGTSSLRAMLYMDEIYGYFPPTKNPPSKTPMLTLLKQARAFGVGVVLATQNPVDLDYKGLSNMGTWFLGRLQTERDKARVLDGLEGASAEAGSDFDRQKMEETLAALGSRVFLMNNVHDDRPVVFHTRWALSYLRGPITRQQISELMQDQKDQRASSNGSNAAGPAFNELSPATSTREEVPHPPATPEVVRPMIPPDAKERFVPANRRPRTGIKLVYRPAILAEAKLHYVRVSYKIDDWVTISLLKAIHDEADLEELWENVHTLETELDLQRQPETDVQFTEVPSELTSKTNYRRWEKSLIDHLYRDRSSVVWKCHELKQFSELGESEDDFRIRLSQVAKEERDEAVEKLRKKYASKFQSLEGQLRRAEEKVVREREQYKQAKYQSAISFGQSVLGALLGRKMMSSTNVTRAGTAMRSASRTSREKSDIARAEDNVEVLEERLEELDREFHDEVEKLEDSLRPDDLELEDLDLRPRKGDIDIKRFCLVWTPWAVDSSGIAEPAY